MERAHATSGSSAMLERANSAQRSSAAMDVKLCAIIGASLCFCFVHFCRAYAVAGGREVQLVAYLKANAQILAFEDLDAGDIGMSSIGCIS